MRAKIRVSQVVNHSETCETLHFNAVAKNDGYPADGSDENNTFAKWTPSAELKLTVTNPDLIGKFEPGEAFYVDFTKAE